RPQFAWLKRLLDTYGSEKRIQSETVSGRKAYPIRDGFPEQRPLQTETDRIQSETDRIQLDTVPSPNGYVLKHLKTTLKTTLKKALLLLLISLRNLEFQKRQRRE
ncbi:hypothetical protein LCGC14_1999390, partial [marine sediment metagenome]